MNNDNFLIEESDILLAQNICSKIEDCNQRNLAMSNVLAAKISKKFFTEVEVDTESSLHNVLSIIKNLDLADIYINGTYIDVRLYLENDSPKVPKELFEQSILPVAYMFIKIDEELSSASVTGFITPEDISAKASLNGDFYVLNEDDLVSYYDIQDLLSNTIEDDYPEDFDIKIFDFLDNRLDDKNDFLKTLLSSKALRDTAINASNAQDLLNGLTFISSVQEEEEEEENIALENDLTLEQEDTLNIIEEQGLSDEIEMDFEPVEIEELSFNETIDLEEVNSIEEETTELEELSFNETIDLEEVNSIEEETTELEEFVSTENLEETTSLDEHEENIEEAVLDEYSIEDLIDNNIEDIEADNDLNFNEFSTKTTPSIDTIEQLESNDFDIQDYENVVTSEENLESEDNNTETLENFVLESNDDEQIEAQDIESIAEGTYEDFADENIEENYNEPDKVYTDEYSNTDLDSLFEHTDDNMENSTKDNFEQQEFPDDTESDFAPIERKSTKVLPLISLVAVIGALAYFGYTKFFNQQENANNLQNQQNTAAAQKTINTKVSTKKAATPMPLETVENIKIPKKSNEGTAISIPAIEQNLDASINVANLSVNWEVPSTYISNSIAKKYFTKIGKIVQLNLKTELLLLNKSPITNKIMLELEFNKNNNKFDVKEIITSSGDKSIDDLILKTVSSSLNINLSTNMSVFNNLTGNPVLIIRL